MIPFHFEWNVGNMYLIRAVVHFSNTSYCKHISARTSKILFLINSLLINNNFYSVKTFTESIKNKYIHKNTKKCHKFIRKTDENII